MRAVRRAALWAAVGSTALTGCEFNGLYDVELPGGAAPDDAYRVTVAFRDVLDLVPQSAVKVNNVTVGAVEKVELRGWHARVTLRVADHVKLPANAVAGIRQTSMLGEKYVSLAGPDDVPSSGRLSDGAKIPLSRSGRNPEIEEVLSALSALLNGGGVAQLHTITTELNKVMDGRENRVKNLLSELDTFVGGLDSQKKEIVRALKGMDKLAKTLRKEKNTINKAVDSMPPALKVLADQRRNLTKMLTALSDLGTVGTRVVNASKGDVVANLKSLDPILTELNEADDDFPHALELMTTYPFPRNVVGAIKGDYTNLHITADLDLRSIYGNIDGEEDRDGDEQDKPDKPEVPDIPDVPDIPGAPDLPDKPVDPDLPAPDLPDGGGDGGGGGGGGDGGSGDGTLCPPVCTGSQTSYRSPDGGPGAGNPLPEGADAALARLLLRGLLS